MEELFQNDEFFRVLFHAIPASVLIVNSEGKVFRMNKSMENLLGISFDPAQILKGGDIFRCIFRKDNPDGCGSGPRCGKCVVKNSAIAAIKGSEIHRQKGKLFIEDNQVIKQLNLLVSSAPVSYKNQKLAIVIVEDLSEIFELQGLLPICSSCKSIRDDKGYWTRLEKYIEEHSEVEFTHGLCSKCIREKYPEIEEFKTKIVE